MLLQRRGSGMLVIWRHSENPY